MAHRRNTWKRFIKTFLSQIHLYKLEYSAKDQKILNDFTDVLQYFNVDTEKNRLLFINEVNKFFAKHYGNEEYMNTPFLWFCCTYLNNARGLLVEAKFHADVFYEYIVQVLRGVENLEGYFFLLRKNTLFTDHRWEKLQFFSNMPQNHLSKEQLQVLKILYSAIRQVDLAIFDQEKLKEKIAKDIDYLSITKNLTSFFEQIDARWYFWILPQSFGLIHLVIQFKLTKNMSIFDLIDFNDPENTLLNSSNIYQLQNSPETYICILILPNSQIHKIRQLFNGLEDDNKLKILNFSKIIKNGVNGSLKLYEESKGWTELTSSELYSILLRIKRKHDTYKDLEVENCFISSPDANNWHYTKYSKPTDAITFFHKITRQFTFQNLPLTFQRIPSESFLSQKEQSLLKKLTQKGIIRPVFRPHRLLIEFSLDYYWIIPPKAISFEHLKNLIRVLPSSFFCITEDESCHLFATLAPPLYQWIKNELKWLIYKIIPKSYSKPINKNWFDYKKLKWKTPIILS